MLRAKLYANFVTVLLLPPLGEGWDGGAARRVVGQPAQLPWLDLKVFSWVE